MNRQSSRTAFVTSKISHFIPKCSWMTLSRSLCTTKWFGFKRTSTFIWRIKKPLIFTWPKAENFKYFCPSFSRSSKQKQVTLSTKTLVKQSTGKGLGNSRKSSYTYELTVKISVLGQG